MSEPTTDELLTRFAQNADDSAFTEIVQRFAGFVQATATRALGGDSTAAEDVTQIVFMDLAKRARSLKGHLLGGWLYRRTRFAAADYRKAESRRRRREEKANGHPMNNDLSAPKDHSNELMGSLDAALATLSRRDQNAIILRFFEEQPLRIVGQALGTSEDAAQKRVSRAVDKLRVFFSARGVAVPAGAFLAALPLCPSDAAITPNVIQKLSKQALMAAHFTTRSTTTTTAIMFTPQLKILATAAIVTTGTLLYFYTNERSQRQRLQTELAQIQQASLAPPSIQEAPATPATSLVRAGTEDRPEPAAADPFSDSEETKPSPEERGKERAQHSYARLLTKIKEKFALREDQATQLQAFYEEREARAAEFYTQAFAGGPIDPKFYFFEVEYWHHIPDELQGMLDDGQLEAYQAYEVEKRINHIETFTNGELSFLQHHLDLTTAQKDALYEPLSQIYSSEAQEDLTWIDSIEAIAERKDWDNNQRRQFFGDVLTEDQMNAWEDVASSYKQQKLKKYGHIADEAGTESTDGEA